MPNPKKDKPFVLYDEFGKPILNSSENEDHSSNEGGNQTPLLAISEKDGDKTQEGKNHQIIVGIGELLSSVVFGTASNMCFSNGHRLWGLWFGFIALVCALAVIYLLITGRPDLPKGKMGCILYTIIAVLFVFVAGCHIDIWRSNKIMAIDAIPHIRFALRSGDGLFQDIELTNSVFFFPDINYKASDIRGNVLIPVDTNKSEFILNFVVINESKKTSIKGGFRMWLYLSQKWQHQYSINDVWTEVPYPTNRSEELTAWTFATKEILYPDLHCEIVGIKCKTKDVVGTSVPFNFMIGFQDTTNTLISTFVSFENSAIIHRPIILTNTHWTGTNNLVFTIPNPN